MYLLGHFKTRIRSAFKVDGIGTGRKTLPCMEVKIAMEPDLRHVDISFS